MELSSVLRISAVPTSRPVAPAGGTGLMSGATAAALVVSLNPWRPPGLHDLSALTVPMVRTGRAAHRRDVAAAILARRVCCTVPDRRKHCAGCRTCARHESRADDAAKISEVSRWLATPILKDVEDTMVAYAKERRRREASDDAVEQNRRSRLLSRDFEKIAETS